MKIHGVVLCVLVFHISVCGEGLLINRTWHTHTHTHAERHEVAAVGSLSWRVEVTHRVSAQDVFSNQVSVIMHTVSHAGLRGGLVLHHRDKQAHYTVRSSMRTDR